MLTQNREMRRDRVHNWTLPAWVVRRTDGSAVNVCPQAGACVKVCYARNGTYNWPGVKAAHLRNLERLDDLGAWTVDKLQGARTFGQMQIDRRRPARGPRQLALTEAPA